MTTLLQDFRTPASAATSDVLTVQLLGEEFYMIRDLRSLSPFFVSVVSPSDHWLFLSTTGGLTAGRRDADQALFPYVTEDKLTESTPHTGPKTLLRMRGKGPRPVVWEPFASEVAPDVERRLYKSVLGHAVVFEELHHGFGLRWRGSWQLSERFGFVRTTSLHNMRGEAVEIEVLDGLQNLLPAGASAQLTNDLSLLLDAYKLNELDAQTGLGVFALNATLSDRAEPSESLRASTVWSRGLTAKHYLLHSGQVEAFRQGGDLETEHQIRGRRGAYFVHGHFTLVAEAEREWQLVAEVGQDSAQVADLRAWLQQTPEWEQAEALGSDLRHTSDELRRLLARVDGFQCTGDERSTGRHLANTLYNTMRGGLFADGYTIQAQDLRDFVRVRNKPVLQRHQPFFDHLPPTLSVSNLQAQARAAGDPELERLCLSYLPLTFSRRHGDPSRPWNRFAIRVRKPDGSRLLDYQGNWRDIFQNWEPLAYGYPHFLPGMLATCLNATTADGYNPYRVTRAGVEWEEPEPENPWANIGYWSDHQINYLVKLLETSQRLAPQRLSESLDRRIYTHVQVPYCLRPYRQILENWSDTIEFDHALNKAISERVKVMGTDGRLLRLPDGETLHVSLTEKLLTLLLAKLVNLVPEGGLWMNTQRPEWNDANNALACKGLSVVTVSYLYRFLTVLEDLLEQAAGPLTLTSETAHWLRAVSRALDEFSDEITGEWSAERRLDFMNRLGEIGTAYRERLYDVGPSGAWTALGVDELRSLISASRPLLVQILRHNRRQDGLYHAYNVLQLRGGGASFTFLSEMLEGQVAILSSGCLKSAQALAVLQSLRQSALYCPKRHTYLLYPDRPVLPFLQKNLVRPEQVSGLQLIGELTRRGDVRLLRQDSLGQFHFGGDLRNAGDLERLLDELESDPQLIEAVEQARVPLLQLFEDTFQHQSFTGRSGTFFAFEGLGSVYWHMVSKLLLAAQEAVIAAEREGAAPETIQGLRAAYDDIRAGLSYNRSVQQYGAFPTDPYSHTPAHAGAKQPGMTGQVKEELLCRPAELGLHVSGGTLHFDPLLLRDEWLSEAAVLSYEDASGKWRTLDVHAGSLAFTWCQVPITVRRGLTDSISVHWQGQEKTEHQGLKLPRDIAAELFGRSGKVVGLIAEFAAQPMSTGG